MLAEELSAISSCIVSKPDVGEVSQQQARAMFIAKVCVRVFVCMRACTCGSRRLRSTLVQRQSFERTLTYTHSCHRFACLRMCSVSVDACLFILFMRAHVCLHVCLHVYMYVCARLSVDVSMHVCVGCMFAIVCAPPVRECFLPMAS